MKNIFDSSVQLSWSLLKALFYYRQGYLPHLYEFWLLNSLNKGFLIDGKSKYLSQKHSFQSVMGLGGVGAGKSTSFVIPNLLSLDNCSFVITDTSGEIFAQTSGDLKQRGFKIKTFNLMELGAGERYNPLTGANSYTEIAQLADTIVSSALSDSAGDQFWNAGASKIIRIFIQCLKNKGDEEFCTLANVKYLINNFDAHLSTSKNLSKTDKFVIDHTQDDPSTWNDYKGFTGGNERTMLAVLSTADTALSALGNPHISSLTAASDFDFDLIRREKTAIFVLVRQQDMKFYSFLLNLFYTELFNSLLHKLDNSHLPAYLMLDEFGHLKIPSFEVFATTARKYKVGFWIFLQSLSQLKERYGHFHAETILNGLQTEIYLPGVSLDTASSLSRRMGNIDHVSGHYVRQTSLMKETEIIQMKNDRALIFHANKKPVVLKTTPFYRQYRLRKKAALTPPKMPNFDLSSYSLLTLIEPD